ncbi:hypothetical protein EI42_05643 [Thermosporothrix hazakensis]|uniref:Uncharacterized protein n=1 Tax=Thermosporothrix hazakensis TaxID=644383 RepID=A0A326TW73_THEHA|nr:hypothetical protein EI42_05643 [Thermosporothrix hazakensis]
MQRRFLTIPPRVLYSFSAERILPITLPSQVESSTFWHENRRAELAAGLKPQKRLFFPIHFCSLCGIGIGPGHLEQEIYIFFVPEGYTLCDKDDNCFQVQEGGELFFICGGCARTKKLGA